MQWRTHAPATAPSLSQPPRVRRRAVAPPTRAGWLDRLFGGGKAEKAEKRPGGMRPLPTANCSTCKNTGGVGCTVCRSTGKDKVKGNPFERYKCTRCQGFGLVPCKCGKGGRGLTPEQTGER